MPFIHFHVPWSNEDLYNLATLRNPSSPSSILTKVLSRRMRLKLHRPYYQPTNQYPSLELFLDPNSSYTLQITYSCLDSLSQLVRYYIYLLPTFLFTVLCVSYSIQVHDIVLRTYQTMLAWQIHLPVTIIITILYKIIFVLFPTSNFSINIHLNGYYFFILPIIMYFLALSLWAIISFIIDYFLLELIRLILHPLLFHIYLELNSKLKWYPLIQWILLIPLLLSVFIFSGSNGHIGLFIIVTCYTIWRGTINRRLREILTTLLLFHSLLVSLNLIGFIVHIKSTVTQGFLPLYMIMPDPSLVSATCCIIVFYCRFLLSQLQIQFIQTIKLIFHKYDRIILISLAILSQFLCSYSMYYLWILIIFVFIHATVVFFVPIHRE